MAKNLFSVPIFFIVFRETLEAAIIISVLLGLAEQLVHEDPVTASRNTRASSDDSASKDGSQVGPIALVDSESDEVRRRRLIRKLRVQVKLNNARVPLFIYIFDQIFAGAGLGLFIALAIGAAYVQTA